MNIVFEIAAERYLPVDDDFIPIGGSASVDGTDFDFRATRPIGTGRYDHNFCLAASAGGGLQTAAMLRSPSSGVAMAILTDRPGLQFYSGDGIPAGRAGLEGIAYGPRTGLCLESQLWPNAPNRPDYPDATLRPGATASTVTEWRFQGGPAGSWA